MFVAVADDAWWCDRQAQYTGTSHRGAFNATLTAVYQDIYQRYMHTS